MHSLLGLYCTKNHKRVLSEIASVWRRIEFIILLFLFILTFFAGFLSSGSCFYVF